MSSGRDETIKYMTNPIKCVAKRKGMADQCTWYGLEVKRDQCPYVHRVYPRDSRQGCLYLQCEMKTNGQPCDIHLQMIDIFPRNEYGGTFVQIGDIINTRTDKSTKPTKQEIKAYRANALRIAKVSIFDSIRSSAEALRLSRQTRQQIEAQLQQSIARVQQLEQQLAAGNRVEDDVTRLGAELERAKEQLQNQAAQVTQLTQESARLRTERDKARGDLVTAKDNIKQLQDQLNELQNQIAILRQEIQQKTVQIQQLQGELQDARERGRQGDDLGKQVAALQRERDKFAQELAREQQLRQQMQNDYQREIQEKQAAQQALEAAKAEIIELRTMVMASSTIMGWNFPGLRGMPEVNAGDPAGGVIYVGDDVPQGGLPAGSPAGSPAGPVVDAGTPVRGSPAGTPAGGSPVADAQDPVDINSQFDMEHGIHYPAWPLYAEDVNRAMELMRERLVEVGPAIMDVGTSERDEKQYFGTLYTDGDVPDQAPHLFRIESRQGRAVTIEEQNRWYMLGMRAPNDRNQLGRPPILKKNRSRAKSPAPALFTQGERKVPDENKGNSPSLPDDQPNRPVQGISTYGLPRVAVMNRNLIDADPPKMTNVNNTDQKVIFRLPYDRPEKQARFGYSRVANGRRWVKEYNMKTKKFIGKYYLVDDKTSKGM